MSEHIQNCILKEAQTIQNTSVGAAKRRPKTYFAQFGFFSAAILHFFGHIPINGCAILASPFKEGCRMPVVYGNQPVGRCNQGQNLLHGFSNQNVTNIVKMYQILSKSMKMSKSSKYEGTNAKHVIFRKTNL